MSNDNVEQENGVEVVNLLSGDAPQEDAPVYASKYEEYAAKAEAEMQQAAEAEAGDKAPEPAPEATEGHNESPAIPDKFQGKSQEDVIKSYQQLESEFGRRGSEIAELRKLTDQLLELNTPKAEAPETTPAVDVDTLLEDPQQAIKKVIENDETIKALRESQVQNAVAADKQVFETAHPNYTDTLNDQVFQEWVMKNPLRQEALVRANNQYDYATAKALFDDYAETHGAKVEQAEEKRNTTARKAAQAAVTEEGGNIQQNSKRKVFKRTELIHLKITNRAKYDSMIDEIHDAYARGDVI